MEAHTSIGRTQSARAQQVEGVAVIGEAVHRVPPESAEFLIEISASASTAAQALRDSQAKFTQLAQALQPLGVQATDLRTISQNVVNIYAPVMQALPTYGMPQIGQANFSAFGPGPGLQPGFSPDIQFGSWHSRNVLRVNVREAARAGEIADAAARAGVTVSGAFQFKVSDEGTARRATLEAAGKDARLKAEGLAAAVGRQVGEAISISEELIASNGAYAAIRAAMPFAFGAGAPQVAGELEYYARVFASFRLQ